MRISPTAKGVLAVPLVFANTALLFVAVWVMGSVLVWAFSLWWLGLIASVAPITFLAALVFVSAGSIRHIR